MGNCLVTKLKGVVDNNNLFKMGALLINIRTRTNPTSENAYIIFSNSKALNVKTDGNGYVSLSYEGLQNQQTEVTVPAGEENIVYFSNGTYRVDVTEKYALTKIYIPNNGEMINYIDLNELKYSRGITSIIVNGVGKLRGNLTSIEDKTDLVNIQANSSYLSGDISSLSNLVNLTEINFASTYNESHVSGNIDSLGKLTQISNMNLYNLNITGSIENFVNAQYINGRTQCVGINAPMILKYVSFGGRHNSDYYQYIKWESNEKISVHLGGTTLENSSTVWTKGYTQGEAEAAFPGKTIVRVDA